MNYLVPPGQCIDAELKNFLNKNPLDSSRVLLFPINLGPIFMKSIRCQAAKYHLEAVYIENEDFNVTAVCHKKYLSQVNAQPIQTGLLHNQYNEKAPVVKETPKVPTAQSVKDDDNQVNAQPIQTALLHNQCNEKASVVKETPKVPTVQIVEDDDKYMREFWEWYNSSRVVQYHYIIEIEKDLFTMPEEYSLAHCVAADLRMGKGIAIRFKKHFGNVDKLLQQNVNPGGIAVLKDKNRYIYYLLTKSKSNGKPTMKALWSSLQNLRKHAEEHKVSKLAIPRIGCGLDRMAWSTVKSMIQYTFKNSNVEIVVCSIRL